ncbi:IclR family transcriptional regulator [Lentzea atacamensis]|uniref:hypothetical protein n=1 Tax=Lentzea atacamensis TaxID=531938 RepID=UPI0011BDCBC5|nr:hypothetical protein [Lentzea atacamensis]
MELREPSGAELTLGWELDSPLAPDDAGGPPGATDNAILTLAACLSCCWPDPDAPPFPGEPTTVHVLRETLEPLGVKEVTRFINCLRSWGYLAPDFGDGLVRLGPAVAVWRDSDLARLRREHDQLPAPKGDTSD